LPPLLKNTIDWLSRVRRDGNAPLKPLTGKLAALCSSSEGQFAGIRAITHLRATLLRCQMEVVTPECSVPRGGEAFDDNGDFRDQRLQQTMARVAAALVAQAAVSARMEA
jgi:NAD(P)H-dependent FMN reductase